MAYTKRRIVEELPLEVWENWECCDFEELDLVTRESQEGMSSIKVVISEDLKARFKSLCALQQVTMSDVLAEFIEMRVREHDKNAALNKVEK